VSFIDFTGVGALLDIREIAAVRGGLFACARHPTTS